MKKGTILVLALAIMCVILAYAISPILVVRFWNAQIEKMVSLNGTITSVEGASLAVTVVVTNHSPWTMTFQDIRWSISTGSLLVRGTLAAETRQWITEFSLAPFATRELGFMMIWEGGFQPPPSYVGGRASVRMDAYVTIFYFAQTFVLITTPY